MARRNRPGTPAGEPELGPWSEQSDAWYEAIDREEWSPLGSAGRIEMEEAASHAAGARPPDPTRMTVRQNRAELGIPAEQATSHEIHLDELAVMARLARESEVTSEGGAAGGEAAPASALLAVRAPARSDGDSGSRRLTRSGLTPANGIPRPPILEGSPSGAASSSRPVTATDPAAGGAAPSPLPRESSRSSPMRTPAKGYPTVSNPLRSPTGSGEKNAPLEPNPLSAATTLKLSPETARSAVAAATAAYPMAPIDPGATTAKLSPEEARRAFDEAQQRRDLATSQRAAQPFAIGSPPIDKPRLTIYSHPLPPKLDPRMILVREPDSPRAAAYRVLRHRLAERGDPRIIAVTSAGPKEGKTTCAVNLALALSECGRARVLLVEANLRSPSLASLFGFVPPECFSAQMELYRERRDLRQRDHWSVVEVNAPSLDVLAVRPGVAGRPILDSRTFAAVVGRLRKADYDYLVLDTPPVLGSADVNLIEEAVDGVLLTTWSRKSSSRALAQALDQLSSSRVLGIALLEA